MVSPHFHFLNFYPDIARKKLVHSNKAAYCTLAAIIFKLPIVMYCHCNLIGNKDYFIRLFNYVDEILGQQELHWKTNDIKILK